MDLISQAGTHGVTWKELGDKLNLHHGQASSSLSYLNKEGHIVGIAEYRLKCRVYVLPKYVQGRTIIPYRRNKKQIVVSHDETWETVSNLNGAYILKYKDGSVWVAKRLEDL